MVAPGGQDTVRVVALDGFVLMEAGGDGAEPVNAHPCARDQSNRDYGGRNPVRDSGDATLRFRARCDLFVCAPEAAANPGVRFFQGLAACHCWWERVPTRS